MTGRAEFLIVTLAISPSVRRRAVPLFVTSRLRKRSSWAMSVQGANAIDQRTIDQARFIRRIESQKPRLQSVEIIQYAGAIRARVQSNGAQSNFAADQVDLEECRWNRSFARILIRCPLATVGGYFSHTLFGDENHFSVIELQREERRIGVEKLRDVLELERAIGREVNENVSPQFLTGQQCKNDCFSSRLDAVQIRAVACQLHGHARKGWAWELRSVKRRFSPLPSHVSACKNRRFFVRVFPRETDTKMMLVGA